MKNLENTKVINVTTGSESLNFMDGLALLLIGLKLTDHLQTWTWTEVLAPLWAPFMISWFIVLVKSTFLNRGEDE
jgi:hypothetical protein